ncbi:MAG: hypothetical protein ACO271_14010, partial [Burkholderiales bacterium]
MRTTLTVAALFAAGTAQAQGYPTKPIRMIVASAPGGAPDILGRAIAQDIEQQLRYEDCDV